MTLLGHVRNGVIVADEPLSWPEGTSVRIEVLGENIHPNLAAPRQRGFYAGLICMAPDFEEWPKDLQQSLGIRD